MASEFLVLLVVEENSIRLKHANEHAGLPNYQDCKQDGTSSWRGAAKALKEMSTM